ncbi:peptide chain release factor-like protein [Patescibacteria group bacterium]|nr:peptide chain release factor-like protein [Patescibacteria group bacterium]
MEKNKVVDYLDYEETWFGRGRRKGKRKEKGPPTKSDKERRKKEIQAVRLARVEEVEKRITKHLSFFPKLETDEDQKQVQSYIEWVKDSLELKSPRLNSEDGNEVKIESFVSSVKAGGQNRQKNRTAVRLKHLPTLISVKNENERSFEQNKQQARTALFEKLEEHLKLWQTLRRNSLSPIDIENKVFSLARIQK